MSYISIVLEKKIAKSFRGYFGSPATCTLWT